VNAHCSHYNYDFESTLVYVLVLPARVIPLSIYCLPAHSKMYQPSAIISHIPATDDHVDIPLCYSWSGDTCPSIMSMSSSVAAASTQAVYGSEGR
jgi:hypothetical protein